MALRWVSTQALDLVARISRPNPASLVATRRDHLVALRIERDLADFVFVPLQNRGARPREHIVNSSHTIGASSRQFVASAVKAGVEHFVRVSAELFNALTGASVPQTRRPVNTACQTVVTSEVKLTAGELS